MNDNYIPKHAKFNELNKLILEENNELNKEIIEPQQNDYTTTNLDNDENNLDNNQNTIRLPEETKTPLTLNELNNQVDINKLTNYTSEFEFYNVKEKKHLTKKNRPKTLLIKILCFILLITFITTLSISVKNLLNWNKDNQETKAMINNIQNDIDIVEVKDDETTELINSETEEETSDYWYYTKFSLIDVDIPKLKEKNKDTVGWINVNNTNVNYPYVQTKDNEFYLNHSYDYSYNDAGWVFLDYRNNSNLDNKNTILYAHSRLDDSMFGSLSETLKSKWYQNKDNHIIRISTDTENSLWQIFSIYKIEEESYYITTNFPTDESYQQFLDTIKGRSIYNFNTTLTTTDKILTLSTCYSDNIRTVIHAKLIKKSIK